MSVLVLVASFVLSLLFVAVIGVWGMRRHEARARNADTNWSTDSGAGGFFAASDSGSSCDSGSGDGGSCDGGGSD